MKGGSLHETATQKHTGYSVCQYERYSISSMEIAGSTGQTVDPATRRHTTLDRTCISRFSHCLPMYRCNPTRRQRTHLVPQWLVRESRVCRRLRQVPPKRRPQVRGK